jgi:hypothetical protein
VLKGSTTKKALDIYRSLHIIIGYIIIWFEGDE